MAFYQQKISKYYNHKVHKRVFKEGDLVLWKIIQNTKRPGKRVLKVNWKEPYKVTKVIRLGVYKL